MYIHTYISLPYLAIPHSWHTCGITRSHSAYLSTDNKKFIAKFIQKIVQVMIRICGPSRPQKKPVQ